MSDFTDAGWAKARGQPLRAGKIACAPAHAAATRPAILPTLRHSVRPSADLQAWGYWSCAVHDYCDRRLRVSPNNMLTNATFVAARPSNSDRVAAAPARWKVNAPTYGAS